MPAGHSPFFFIQDSKNKKENMRHIVIVLVLAILSSCSISRGDKKSSLSKTVWEDVMDTILDNEKIHVGCVLEFGEDSTAQLTITDCIVGNHVSHTMHLDYMETNGKLSFTLAENNTEREKEHKDAFPIRATIEDDVLKMSFNTYPDTIFTLKKRK